MTFDKLRAINVNEHTEQKDGLTYLSWAWAWDEVKKTYPDAVYKVWKDEEGRPYIYDSNLGYMCFTSVTIEGRLKQMMDKVWTIKGRKADVYMREMSRDVRLP